MFGMMDLVSLAKDAIVGINQLGTYGERRYEANTPEAIMAIHHFFENRMFGGYATVYLSCGCQYMFNARDSLTSESLCENHAETLDM